MNLQDFIFSLTAIVFIAVAAFTFLIATRVQAFGRAWCTGHYLISFGVFCLGIRHAMIMIYDLHRKLPLNSWPQFVAYVALPLLAGGLMGFGGAFISWRIRKFETYSELGQIEELQKLADKVFGRGKK